MKYSGIGSVSAFLVFAAVFLVASGAGAVGLNGDAAYTDGPNVCGQCHPDVFSDWLSHGHSRQLSVGPLITGLPLGMFGIVSDARTGGIVLPGHTPAVYDWNNILFVIGASKHWKTNYVGFSGYILTQDGGNQYNWASGSFSDFNRDAADLQFTCGACHTTGYRSPSEGGTTLAGIPGIVGDFAHLNITCEACHGPGATHAAAPAKTNIVKNTSAVLCGGCHTRGGDSSVILAEGGFIQSEQQYTELLSGPHKGFSCVQCHDPHVTRAAGIKVPSGAMEICSLCHGAEVNEFQGSAMQQAGVQCQDCHMAKATKSAVANGPYEGDVRTHIFKIDSDAGYTMFTPDGTAVAGDDDGEGALSIEFACFRCHADADKATYAAIGDEGSDYHTIGK